MCQFKLVESSFFLGSANRFRSRFLRLFNYMSVPRLNSAGRNRAGRITSYHRGPVSKHLSRAMGVDRSRLFFFFCPALVVKSRYFRFRRWFDFICYDNGFVSFYRSIEGLLEGSLLINSFSSVCLGGFSQIAFLPLGASVNSISFFEHSTNVFSGAPGTVSKILKKNSFKGLALVSLPSGEKRFIKLSQVASLGRLASFKPLLSAVTKAGTPRTWGRRPHVRGVAMNPIDHPHGGGQGKTSGGRPSSSPWGVYTKGKRTTKFKCSSRFVFCR